MNLGILDIGLVFVGVKNAKKTKKDTNDKNVKGPSDGGTKLL